VNVLPIAEALGDGAPGRAGGNFQFTASTNSQLPFLAVAPNMTGGDREENARSVQTDRPEAVTSQGRASIKKAPHESRFARFANPLNDDAC